MEYSISNISRAIGLRAVPLSLSVLSNNSGLLIENNCNMMPVWTLCMVESRGDPINSDPFRFITVTSTP